MVNIKQRFTIEEAGYLISGWEPPTSRMDYQYEADNISSAIVESIQLGDLFTDPMNRFFAVHRSAEPYQIGGDSPVNREEIDVDTVINTMTSIVTREDLRQWIIATNQPMPSFLATANELSSSAYNQSFQELHPHTSNAMLTALKANKRFWENIDPEDSGTFPSKSAVTQWVIENTDCSKNMAEAIATILSDGRKPPGGRPAST